MNYYEQLGIAVDSDFTAVKKAYYRRAKECHPDLFGNAPEKVEEFKRLVMIFDTLSDPVKRRSYDETILVESRIACTAPCGADSIMDTGADDTLEELIVGNDPPEDTRLTTLFLDLEKTFVFMTCREAKIFMFQGNTDVRRSFSPGLSAWLRRIFFTVSGWRVRSCRSVSMGRRKSITTRL